jgi:hypothetical protein
MTEHDLEQIRALLRDALAPMQADLAAVKNDVGAQGGELAALRADVGAQGGELAALRADVDAVKKEIDGWPDLHFLQAMAQQQIREAAETREARRYIEIKLDEIYSSMATSSEIKRLRDEVSTSLDRERLLDLRISAIEMRLGIRNPLAPTE